MKPDNTEESFVLATVNEFVKTWGSGKQAHLNLECKNGIAWVHLAFKLGPQVTQHYSPRQTPKPVPPPYVHPQARRRHKGPSRRDKDCARAAAHRARIQKLTESHPSPSKPPPVAPTGKASQPPAASTGSPRPAATTDQPNLPPPAASTGSTPPAGTTGQPNPPPAAVHAGPHPLLPASVRPLESVGHPPLQQSTATVGPPLRPDLPGPVPELQNVLKCLHPYI